MNESFVLRFKRGSQPWRVRSLITEGIVFDEPDAPTRRLVLDFDTISPIVETRLDRIRELHGWRPWQFELRAFLNDGGLGFRGVDPHALPSGDYRIRTRIEGLDTPGTWTRFRVPQNGSATADVQVTLDMRTIRTALDAGVDAEIERVLGSASRIDTAPTCRAWLGLSGPRATRKACLLNILGLLRVTPAKTDSLIKGVTSVLQVRDDRVYCAVDKSMYTRVSDLARDAANRRFYLEGEPHAPVHLELLDALPQPFGRHSHRLESYRAEASSAHPSLQAVFAIPKSSGDTAYFAEFDIDLGNPLQDVEGFAIHIGELLDNKPTNHLDLRAKLTRAADFLYYSVVNA